MYYEDSLDTTPLPPKGKAKPAAPASMPAKFVDPATGEVRVDQLLRSYLELERRMAQAPGDGQPGGAECGPGGCVPAEPDGYDIRASHPQLGSNKEVNSRLHQAGFTQDQAQLVYDLAHQLLPAMVDRATVELKSAHALDKLKTHFGGEARWTETARQLAAWGKANLPPQVFQALAAVPEGVVALHRMMEADEPGLGRQPGASDQAPGEEELKRMMQDPRYWKTRDPAYIEKVSSGFRKLYGE
jgi:hypothetical protein